MTIGPVTGMVERMPVRSVGEHEDAGVCCNYFGAASFEALEAPK